MKNKKLLYGILGVGALAVFYFFNKNKKVTNQNLAVVDNNNLDNTQSVINNVQRPSMKFDIDSLFAGQSNHNRPKKYSKECQDRLQVRLMYEDAKPPNFEKNFLENCSKQ